MARTARLVLPGIAALLLLVELPSCRTAAPTPVLSESAVTLDLPIVRQDELYDCGLAAISALCQYWSVEIPAQRRSELAARAKEKEGLSGSELRETLEDLGLETFLFSGTLDRSETGLYRHVDSGRPLLVMLGSDSDSHHYCLFLGYDEPRRNAVLLDPARGPVVRPLDVFTRDWERCRRFTLLACPKSSAPAASKAAEKTRTRAPPLSRQGPTEANTPRRRRDRMKAHHPLHVLGLLLLTTPALAAPRLGASARGAAFPPTESRPTEWTQLRASEDPSLGELRAGALTRSVDLPESDRTALRQAESANPDLGALRGGSVELSDRDLTIIAIVVGVVLILVLL